MARKSEAEIAAKTTEMIAAKNNAALSYQILDERIKNLDAGFTSSMQSLGRKIERIQQQIEARDAALAEFEVKAVAALATLLDRLPPGNSRLATLQDIHAGMADLLITLSTERQGHISALNGQREAFNMLRQALDHRGQIDHDQAYNVLLIGNERERAA